MSDVQQAILSTEKAGALDCIYFGERNEYRAWRNGKIETCKAYNGQGRLLDEWRECSTKKYASDKSGGYYWNVAAWFGGKNYPRIHLIVCTLFHGPRPSLKHQVNHIDGNRDNNSADNLEWTTAAENMANAVRRGAFEDLGLGRGMMEEDDCCLLSIVTQLDSGITNTELGRRYDKDPSTFSRISSGNKGPTARFWYLLKKNNPRDVFGADLPILKTDYIKGLEYL